MSTTIITPDNQRLAHDDAHSRYQVMYYKGFGIEFVVSFFPKDPTEKYIDDASVSCDGTHYVYEIDATRHTLRTMTRANSWLSEYGEQEGAQLGEIPEHCRSRILGFLEFFLRTVPNDPLSAYSVSTRKALQRAKDIFSEKYAP